jgi:hypothetical protein
MALSCDFISLFCRVCGPAGGHPFGSDPHTSHVIFFHPIAWQSFDHAEGDPVEGAISVDAESKVILVEGNYLLMFDTPPWDGLKSLFDERWFVSCEQPILR